MAADAGNGMFRCDIPRGSYTSDMLGACLLFHNDCDTVNTVRSAGSYVWAGNQNSADYGSYSGAFSLNQGHNSSSHIIGVGACLGNLVIVTCFG